MSLRFTLDLREGKLRTSRPLIRSQVTIKTDQFQDTRLRLPPAGLPGDSHTGQTFSGNRVLYVEASGRVEVSITVPGTPVQTLTFELTDDLLIWTGEISAYSVVSLDTSGQRLRVIHG
jgi:hypothetical protein